MISLRWFGESWDARVCAPERRVETPARPCKRCRAPVLEGQRGFILEDGVWHLTCFLGWIGARQVHVLFEGRPLCGFTTETPQSWPSGHAWIPVKIWEEATCDACRELAPHLLLQVSAPVHGMVMPWPHAWGEAADHACDWKASCSRIAVCARYDGTIRRAWVYCCLECSGKGKREKG